MLARRYRLSARVALVRRGKTVRTPHFLLRVFESSAQNPRFSVVVSRKTAKRAVVRNRLRRRGYRALAVSLPAAALADVVITVLPDAVPLPSDEFSRALTGALRQAHVIR